jgi:Cd2+/Zn2+-exporting ATPase
MRKKNSIPDSSGYPPDVSDAESGGNGYSFDRLLVIRLVLASVLFAVALAAKLTVLLSTILLVLSAAVAGYDILLQAINDVAEKRYISPSLIVVFAAVVSFAIGFGSEGAALLILYKIGLLLLDYTKARTVSSAIDFIPEDQDDIVTHLTLLFSNEETGRTAFDKKAAGITRAAVKVLLAAALVYAVVLPLITDFSYVVSIHRALTLMIVATPISVVSSMRLCDIVGIGFTASAGVVYNNSAAFDATSGISSAVFDKAGVFSDGRPKVASVKSALMKPDVFIKIAAHIAQYSSLPAARAVSEEYDGVIMTEVISDHSEIPNCGSEIIINGVSMCLGTKDMMSLKGVHVPEEDIRIEGTALYMSIAGRYVGCVTMGEGVNPDSAAIVDEYRQSGIDDCVLITDDGSDASSAFATSIGVSEFYANCRGEDKLAAVSKCSEAVSDGKLLYVYSGRQSVHSGADIDACVGSAGTSADIFLTRNGIREIPFAKSVSARSAAVEKENAAGAALIKILIVILTLTGFCNLWFAVFLDMAAALAAVLNSIRVSMPPLFTVKKKSED